MRKFTIPLVLLLLLVGLQAAKYGSRYVGIDLVGPQRIVAVVVEEAGARPTLPEGQLMSLTSMKIPAWAEAGGHRYLEIDDEIEGPDGLPPPELVPFLDRAKDKPLPYLIVASVSGVILHEGSLPGEDESLRLLKKYGGE